MTNSIDVDPDLIRKFGAPTAIIYGHIYFDVFGTYHNRKQSWVEVSDDSIAKGTGLNIKHVPRAIRQLSKDHYICVQTIKGENTTTRRYRFVQRPSHVLGGES